MAWECSPRRPISAVEGRSRNVLPLMRGLFLRDGSSCDDAFDGYCSSGCRALSRGLN